MRDADAAQLPDATPVQLIDEQGARVEHAGYHLPDTATLLDGYAALVQGRRINEQCNALVRQGRLAVYPSSHGQEACQIAAATVLKGSIAVNGVSLTVSGLGDDWLQVDVIPTTAAETNLGALKIVLGLRHFLLYLAYVLLFALLAGLITNLIL